MNVTEQPVTQLVSAGVHRIHGIVGNSLNPIVGAVRKTGGSAKGGIDQAHVRYEEAATFAAAAEARLTGELSVCAGSCDPGNLHLVSGLYDIQRSGTPALAIVSHIPSVQIGQSYSQETHPDRLFNECSVYSEFIPTPKQAPRAVNVAIRHVVSLSGVSVISLPGDVSDEKATVAIPEYFKARPVTLSPNPADAAEVFALLNKSRKVAIFVGAGVKSAHDEVVALADLLRALTGHLLRGKDFIQYDNSYDVDMTGPLGYGAAAEGVKDADVLPLPGTDFPYDQFLPNTVTIQVDNHAEKLGWHTDISHPIHSDIIPFVEVLIPHIKKRRSDTLLKVQLRKHVKIMRAPIGTYTCKVDKIKPVYSEYTTHVFSEAVARDAIFTTDTGMCNVRTARYIDPLGMRRFTGSFLYGSMANALPHVIGAQVSYPHRQAIPASGDGGLSMLMGEPVTARMHNLPIKVVVFNSSTLGMVKFRMLVNGLPDFGTDAHDVNYAGVAQSIGLHAERVDDPRDLHRVFQKAFDLDGPVLVEVATDPNAPSLPPEITGGQLIGFATVASETVLNRGAGEAVGMVTSNMCNIPCF